MDRNYHDNRSNRGYRGGSRYSNNHGRYPSSRDSHANRSNRDNHAVRENRRNHESRKCYICGKSNHFWRDHPEHEQREHKARYIDERTRYGGKKTFSTFLLSYEGDPEEQEKDKDDTSGSDEEEDNDTSESDGFFAAAYLNDQSFCHRAGWYEPPPTDNTTPILVHKFALDRYLCQQFQGILPDTGAAKSSTARME